MTRSAEAVIGAEEDVRREFDPIEIEEGASLWRDAWYRLRRNRLALISLFIFAAITLFCVVGPFFSPWDSEQQDLLRGAQGPSAAHWFGTDTLGRDLMVRTMEGGGFPFWSASSPRSSRC